MSNRSSNAGHIPQRTCIICRKKSEKQKLMKFVLLDTEIVFDLNSDMKGRGYYVCNENSCLQKLDKRVMKLITSRKSDGR